MSQPHKRSRKSNFVSNKSYYFGLFCVFFGCCLNATTLEYIVSLDPGAGILLTASQFFGVTLFSFIFLSLKSNSDPDSNKQKPIDRILKEIPPHLHSGVKSLAIQLHSISNVCSPIMSPITRFFPKSTIPVSYYILMVILFSMVNLLNNYAFKFNIPLPFHVLFRSGSIFSSLLIAKFLLKEQIQLNKWIGGSLVTVGVVFSTFATNLSLNHNLSILPENDQHQFDLLIGIFIMTIALGFSSLLGKVQYSLFQTFQPDWQEGIFYSHCLATPIMLFFISDIINHFSLLSYTPIVFQMVTVGHCALIANVVTQFMCICGVYLILNSTDTITLQVVLSVRKFLSLLISIWYFGNPFTKFHWFAVAFVICGTIVYKIPTTTKKTEKTE